MSLGCHVDRRDRADRLREHVVEDARVLDADRVQNDATGRWGVEVTLSERCDGFPTDILYCLGFPVVVRNSDPQGDVRRATLLI